jgi:hypothetical protein
MTKTQTIIDETIDMYTTENDISRGVDRMLWFVEAHSQAPK